MYTFEIVPICHCSWICQARCMPAVQALTFVGHHVGIIHSNYMEKAQVTFLPRHVRVHPTSPLKTGFHSVL